MACTIKLGSKAQTLRTLYGVLTAAEVPASLVFQVGQWRSSPQQVLESIQKEFSETLIVVRSSAGNEDSVNASHAGEYTSVLDVPSSELDRVEAAIEEVIRSYDTSSDENEFFVQQQIRNIKLSGVVMTRDLVTLAPYFVVNYDDRSGSTSSVTSGSQGGLKTYVRFKGSPNNCPDPDLKRVIIAAEELERLTGLDALDIEFALTREGTLFILQVRAIANPQGRAAIDTERFGHYLLKVYKKIQKLNAPHPGIHGDKAIYSVMTDWNPAEIIGINPRPLALSLYKELVTDAIWAYQRAAYGYRDLRSFPLLVSFLGCPYIDVRASLNSFIPAELDDGLTAKLVDYYIDKLTQSPTDHDKVEFNIVFSCYYLNLTGRLNDLREHGFSELELDRIKFALLNLTNRIIAGNSPQYKNDLKKVQQLEKRFNAVMSSDLSINDKIYWLVENCKRYGTLPFAGLARAGFIAVQFLRSFVELNIITALELDRFMNSLNTVASQLSADVEAYYSGALSREQFLSRYGHLRPGTYDIMSRRYDEAFESFFTPRSTSAEKGESRSREPFTFSAEQRSAIEKLLVANGIQAGFDDLLSFIKEAIEGRESSKFLFTHSLSGILLLIEELGKKYGFAREDMSYLDIRCVLGLCSDLTIEDLDALFAANISKNKQAFAVTQMLRLPQLITSERHIYDFHVGEVEPNYITQSRVTEIIVLEEDLLSSELMNRIVMIHSADPGYDWLFMHKIAGLITMYGGANSHMAIRCAELGIPAAIGCGEKNFQEWAKAKVLELDCSNHLVRAISPA
jgi:hypothetical protein